MALTITALGAHHDRQAFDCGEATLNTYLRRYAKQDITRSTNRVFVASATDIPEQIMGYYSLSACHLTASTLPDTLRRRLPKYPVPAALLGRLAVAVAHQRQGCGAILLADAIQRIVRAQQAIAIYAIVVDALDETALQFYQYFGFLSLAGQPRKLFLPMNTITHLCAAH